MITLYNFGRAFGLPDPSPFVTKAEMLLKLAGLSYRLDSSGFRRAPKGKLPYIDDDGTIIADSTLIRFHIERKYGFDFDAGLSPEERSTAWAFEKMCEEHLYWGAVKDRWLDQANFRAGPAHYFDSLPAVVRPVVGALVRHRIRRTLKAQGLGRHSDKELDALMSRAIAALAQQLGEKPYFMGPHPCGADATVFAFAVGMLCPRFTGPVRRAAERHANLVAYRDRLMHNYYPELAG